MTSSPGPIPSASRARWRAAVAELTATAWRTPSRAATASSKRKLRSPVVSQPESRTSRTAARSAGPREGRWKGMARPVAGALMDRARAGGMGSRIGTGRAQTHAGVGGSAQAVGVVEELADGLDLSLGGGDDEAVDQPLDGRRVGLCPSGPDTQHAGVDGPLGRLVVVEQRFVEPLAGPEAGELDRHPLGIEPGEPDESVGQVDDADRLAH